MMELKHRLWCLTVALFLFSSASTLWWLISNRENSTDEQWSLQSVTLPDDSPLRPPCTDGLLLWRSRKTSRLRIWSPVHHEDDIREEQLDDRRKLDSRDYFCACPMGYHGRFCERARTNGDIARNDDKTNTIADRSSDEWRIPAEMKTLYHCYTPWGHEPKYYPMGNVNQSSLHYGTVERYLSHRLYGSVLVSMRTGQTNRDVQPLLSNGERLVDDFFASLALRHTGWKDSDMVMIRALLDFNQRVFEDSDKGRSTARIRDWFSGSNIIPGKLLYTFMFSKCHLIHMMKLLLHSVYARKHYYVIYLSDGMGTCRSIVENMVSQLLSANRGNTAMSHNILIVPPKWSIRTQWGHRSLVYMNILPVIHSYWHGWTDWSHEINLSESHLPLRSVNDLSHHLGNHTIHHSFMQVPKQYIPQSRALNICIESQFMLNVTNELCTVGADAHSDNTVVLTGASQWKVWSNTLWRFMLSSELGVNTLFQMMYVTITDELFFGTFATSLQRLSSLPSRDQRRMIRMVDGHSVNALPFVTVEDNLTLTLWTGGKSPLLLSQYTVAYVWDAVRNGKFFARKFHNTMVGQLVLDTLGLNNQTI